MSDIDPRPTTLRGDAVTLVPLQPEHAADLARAGSEASIWEFMPIDVPIGEAGFRTWIDDALAQDVVAFCKIVDGVAVGSTRYLGLRRADRGLEIGFTWIGPRWQRTRVNTECKRLLLAHAFDDLGAERVQFKTDSRNVRSQRAIERLGAVHEGVLRRHMLVKGSAWRDSVYYSIIRADWPDVRARLDGLLSPA